MDGWNLRHPSLLDSMVSNDDSLVIVLRFLISSCGIGRSPEPSATLFLSSLDFCHDFEKIEIKTMNVSAMD